MLGVDKQPHNTNYYPPIDDMLATIERKLVLRQLESAIITPLIFKTTNSALRLSDTLGVESRILTILAEVMEYWEQKSNARSRMSLYSAK